MSMVAGGSGITPCYDVAREVLQDPTDSTRMSLVYANKHVEDIWLREVGLWAVAAKGGYVFGGCSSLDAACVLLLTVLCFPACFPARSPAFCRLLPSASVLQELDTMAAENPDRFHVWYVVEEPHVLGAALGTAAAAAGAVGAGTSPAAAAAAGAAAAEAGAAAAAMNSSGRWKFSKGWVTPDMLAQHLLPPRPVILPAAAAAGPDGSSIGGGGSLALMCGPPGMLENVVVPSLTALGFGPEQMVVF